MTGVQTCALPISAAALAIMPVMISFDFPEFETYVRSHAFCGALLCIVALLMVSRIPTFSTKKLKVPTWMFIPMMLIVAFFANFVITQPWLTLGLMTVIYALSIPVSVLVFLHEKRTCEK